MGQAAIVPTNDPKGVIKYLISAPTMRIPADIRGTVNAYLAFRATLIESMRCLRIMRMNHF